MLFGSQDATLYCLDAASGKLVWKYAIADQIRCTPTIADGRCFVAGCDGRLHVIDLDKGEEQSSVDIGSPTGVTPAAVGDRVFFGTEGSAFWPSIGSRPRWCGRFPTRIDRSRSAVRPRSTESIVVVGGRNKRVQALDPADGKPLWNFAAKTRVDSSPVIVGSRVFVGRGRRTAVCAGPEDRPGVWEHELTGGFTGSPAVADGRLVIASDEGVVYCFGKEMRALRNCTRLLRSTATDLTV